jgi:hypothetical protein
MQKKNEKRKMKKGRGRGKMRNEKRLLSRAVRGFK